MKKCSARMSNTSETGSQTTQFLGACHQECQNENYAGGSPKCLKTMSLYRISRAGSKVIKGKNATLKRCRRSILVNGSPNKSKAIEVMPLKHNDLNTVKYGRTALFDVPELSVESEVECSLLQAESQDEKMPTLNLGKNQSENMDKSEILQPF